MMSAFVLLRLAHALAALRVLLFTFALLPADDMTTARTRWRLASAIVSATIDRTEQDLLASIARHESLFERAVVDCETFGVAGDRGAWQVVPLSLAEGLALCVSYEQDARIALDRARQSVRACRHLPPPERLAVYARGRCDSVEGRRLSRVRWPTR